MLRAPALSLRSLRAPLRRWASTRANVMDELEERGFVANVTSPALRTHLESPSCVYVGVDPSASSLHVGNLLPLLGLLHFRARGHHVVALIGGATGSIGDPSGRSTERNALSPSELAVNVAGITSQVERFFDRGIAYANKRGYEADASEAQKQVTVVNNYDWFKDMTFLEFLRDVGKLARVNTMLARDSVKSRLESEQGISFTEFSYQLLQAHDFATLYRTHECRVQLGGSDQWGNIVAGIDMIKRVRANEAREQQAAEGSQKNDKEAQAQASKAPEVDPAFGLTIPLLTTSTGEKFGKSMGNAIWLDENRTSVFDFYQFFLRARDDDVEKYLSLLTLVPRERIVQVMEEHAGARGKRIPQQLLAREVTEMVHGLGAVERAETIAAVLYANDPRSLKSADVLEAFGSDPRLVRIHQRDLQGKQVSKLLAEYGLVASRAEANRLIKPSNSGVSINELQVTDPRREISSEDYIDDHLVILRRGTRDMIVFYIETE